MAMDENYLRKLLASGQITQEQLSQMPISVGVPNMLAQAMQSGGNQQCRRRQLAHRAIHPGQHQCVQRQRKQQQAGEAPRALLLRGKGKTGFRQHGFSAHGPALPAPPPEKDG